MRIGTNKKNFLQYTNYYPNLDLFYAQKPILLLPPFSDFHSPIPKKIIF